MKKIQSYKSLLVSVCYSLTLQFSSLKLILAILEAIIIGTSFIENPWINRTYKEAEWTFPSNAMQNLRYRVFKEFWEQGYFLTHGSKFGGDFLVYPGKLFLFLYTILHFKSAFFFFS